MKHAHKLFTVLFLFSSLVSYAAVDTQTEWTKVTDTEDGIVVFEREIPGSPVLAFKGSGTVNAPLGKVASAIFDVSRAKEWVLNLEETRRVRWFSDNEFLQYDHVGTPIVMKDRDFVSRVKMSIEAALKRVTFEYHSTTDDQLPETGYVRGDLMTTVFVLSAVEGGAKTKIEGEIHADPKGSVAKWIVNFFQRQWPVDTLRSLRKQVAKTDIKIDPHFAGL